MRFLTPRLTLTLFLSLYAILALAHAMLAPLTTGPDELAHYEYVNFIATHGRLPLTLAERAQASYKSDQPPLFHLLAAIPASWVEVSGPPLLKRATDHPHRQLIERARHAWGLYNTEDERWPYHGEVLRWQVGRWVAISFSLAALIITFFMARAILLNEWLALAVTATVGLIPRFILTGSMLNYEALTTCMATLAWWQIWRVSQSSGQPSASQLVSQNRGIFLLPRPMGEGWGEGMVGLFIGLTIITKLSALILPLEVVIAYAVIARHHGGTWQQFLTNLTITALACGLVISLWFGFVFYQFNTITQDGWWTGSLRPLIAADGSDTTTNRLLNFLTGGEAGSPESGDNRESGSLITWLITFFRTFWVVGIEGQQPLVPLAPFIMMGVSLAAMYGLTQLYRHQPAHRLTLQLLTLHVTLPIILPLIRFTINGSLADTAQGRHLLFLAAPAFALLLIWGLSDLLILAHFGVQRFSFAPPTVSKAKALHSSLPEHHLLITHYSLFIVPTFLSLWTLTQLYTMTWAYNPPLPVSVNPMPIAHPLEKPFNDAIKLLGYDYQLTPDQLQIDLIWQTTALSPQDYLTEVNLLNSQGHLMAQWLGYPTNGRYPMRAWDKGDFIRDTAWLPLAGLPSGDYHLTLNLRPLSQTAPLLAQPLILTQLNLTPPPAPTMPQLSQHGTSATLHDRESFLITMPTDQPVSLIMANQTFTMPLSHIGYHWLFMVAPDWPSGQYSVVGTNLTFEVKNSWPRQFTAPPMSYRVEANFANQIKLLGYELPSRRAAPGEAIPLTLYWQSLAWLDHDYTIFVKPIATTNQTAYGGRDRLPREGYRTLYWTPNEIISDPLAVPIDIDAPNGLYTLHVGLYNEVNGQPSYLPLMQDNQPQAATSITIGPIKIGATPPDFTLTTAQPQYPLSQPFGDTPNLTLLGYDLRQNSSTVTLRLYWQCESPLPLDYTIFVHVRNNENKTVAQQDQPPTYPTSLWDKGEIIATDITLTLPTDLAPANYQIVMGLYDFNTGQRLTVPNQPDNSLSLPTTIEMNKD